LFAAGYQQFRKFALLRDYIFIGVPAAGLSQQILV
jgi:hypothetical protein